MLARDPLQTAGARLARALGIALLAAAPAAAQPIDRPVQERPELPEFAEEGLEDLAAPAESMLPAVPVPEVPDLRVTVRGFQVEGGTVFTAEEIAKALSPWTMSWAMRRVSSTAERSNRSLIAAGSPWSRAASRTCRASA